MLIPPENHSPYKNAVNYIRFENGASGQGIGADGYVAQKNLDRQQLELIHIWGRVDGCVWQKLLIRKEGRQMNEFLDRFGPKSPLPENADQVYLRLELRDDWFNFFVSSDGENWTRFNIQSGLSTKIKLGLAAYSTSSEPSKVRFDRLKLIRLRKKEHGR